jgi:hypothetical protein
MFYASGNLRLGLIRAFLLSGNAKAGLRPVNFLKTKVNQPRITLGLVSIRPGAGI